MNKGKGQYFKEGSLLPIWTLPYECKLCDKMQVYKELTGDWVKSKVVKSKFDLQNK